MEILACQIEVPAMVAANERDRHLERVAGAIDRELAKGRVDLVLLPELASIDYAVESFQALEVLAEEERGPSFNYFGALAKRHGTHICYGFARRRVDGGYSISQGLVGSEGQWLGCYDKIHLAQLGASVEKDFFVPGQGLLVFEVTGWRIAPTICYDIRFAELYRQLVFGHGCDLILHPTAFYRDETFHSWHAFAMTRAMENQVYFLSLNRGGRDYGESLLVPPWCDGERPQVRFGVEEEFRRLRLERSALDQARRDFPYHRDLRDDYQELPLIQSGGS